MARTSRSGQRRTGGLERGDDLIRLSRCMSRAGRQPRITAPAAAFMADAHDFPDRRDAATAFDPASQTAVDLMGGARQLIRAAHGRADVVIGQDIAGANNHASTIPVFSRSSRDNDVTRRLIYSAASASVMAPASIATATDWMMAAKRTAVWIDAEATPA